MSIHFSQIHNLVRTYQHVLNLDSKQPAAKPEPSDTVREDRVTVSPEARELQQQQPQPPKPPASASHVEMP